MIMRALLPFATCCALATTAPPALAEPAAPTAVRRTLAEQEELFELCLLYTSRCV